MYVIILSCSFHFALSSLKVLIYVEDYKLIIRAIKHQYISINYFHLYFAVYRDNKLSVEIGCMLSNEKLMFNEKTAWGSEMVYM